MSPLNISKYREIETKTEGEWFKAPADVFGIRDESEATKLDIQFKLRPYPDKVLREHSRKATKPFNITGRRRQSSMSLDDRFNTEKFRELKYCYVIEDFKGLVDETNGVETPITVTDENKMCLINIFPDLSDWIDEITESLSNFIKEDKEELKENLETSSSS